MSARRKSRRGWRQLAAQFLFAMAWAAGAATLGEAPKVYLPPCFSDNMVLEKAAAGLNDAPLIWGWADKRCDVFVQIGSGQPIRAQTWDEVPTQDQLKAWVVRYGMLGASPTLPDGAFDITVSGKKRKSETATYMMRNAVAGEVWLLIDPEFAINPRSTPADVKLSGDVRVLSLRTGNFSVSPADAGAITLGTWQVLAGSQTRLNNQLAVADYYLEWLRANGPAGPVGILLISQTQWRYFSHYLPEHDLTDLPADDRAAPEFIQPWLNWKNAWQRAGDEWNAAWFSYKTNLVLLKRQGKVPDAPAPKMPPLQFPSIKAGNLPDLKYAIRGTLH